MALSTSTVTLPFKCIIDSHPSKPNPLFSSSRSKFNTAQITLPSIPNSGKWRNMVSFFPGFLTRGRDVQSHKVELYETIAPLDRGAEATPEEQQRVDQIACKLEAVNSVKEPLKSDLLNGKQELFCNLSINSAITAIKSPVIGLGQLEITYLDEDLRISRGDRGNFFVLKMVDPTYRVPL